MSKKDDISLTYVMDTLEQVTLRTGSSFGTLIDLCKEVSEFFY